MQSYGEGKGLMLTKSGIHSGVGEKKVVVSQWIKGRHSPEMDYVLLRTGSAISFARLRLTSRGKVTMRMRTAAIADLVVHVLRVSLAQGLTAHVIPVWAQSKSSELLSHASNQSTP